MQYPSKVYISRSGTFFGSLETTQTLKLTYFLLGALASLNLMTSQVKFC